MEKVIMVSGANRGIGKAIALNLYKNGFFLSLGIRDLEAIDTDILRLKDNENKVLLASYDTSNPNSDCEWIQETYQKFNRIDGLVNNAGIYYSLDIEDDNEEMLDQLLNINTKAPMRLSRLALPYIRQSGEGRIINIVSDGAKRVDDSVVGYSVSKYGFLAASHAMMHAAKQHGVRVTALCPGWVNTDMAKNMSHLPPEKMIQSQTIADIVIMLLNLPNTVMIPELVLENT